VYSTNHALLIYDGNCGMCSSSATWITKKWKKPHTAEAVPSQWLSEADLQALGLSADDVKRAAWSNSSDYADSGERYLSVEGLFP
jgi:predicted DCC family thiol-disulfide oxidoreductase YuxK